MNKKAGSLAIGLIILACLVLFILQENQTTEPVPTPEIQEDIEILPEDEDTGLFSTVNKDSIVKAYIYKRNSYPARYLQTNVYAVLEDGMLQDLIELLDADSHHLKQYIPTIRRNSYSGVSVVNTVDPYVFPVNLHFFDQIILLDDAGNQYILYLGDDSRRLSGGDAHLEVNYSYYLFDDKLYQVTSPLFLEINRMLDGQPVFIEWEEEGWSDSGEYLDHTQEFDFAYVSASPDWFKEVIRPEDMAQLTERLQNLSMICTGEFLGNMWNHNLGDDTIVASIISPGAERTWDSWLDYLGYIYTLLEHDGEYYLGYFDTMDLKLDTAQAQELLHFIEELDYERKADDLYPYWWKRQWNYVERFPSNIVYPLEDSYHAVEEDETQFSAGLFTVLDKESLVQASIHRGNSNTTLYSVLDDRRLQQLIEYLDSDSVQMNQYVGEIRGNYATATHIIDPDVFRFSLHLEHRIVFTDSSGEEHNIYFGGETYHNFTFSYYIYQDKLYRVNQSLTQNINMLLEGHKIVMGWALPVSDPATEHSDDFTPIFVGVNPDFYKEVSDVEDIKKLTDLMRNLTLTCTTNFLTGFDNAYLRDMDDAIVATVISPDTGRITFGMIFQICTRFLYTKGNIIWAITGIWISSWIPRKRKNY